MIILTVCSVRLTRVSLLQLPPQVRYNEYKIDKPYFFNRKEEKDHGEGGSLVGYKPQDGDKVIIIEDVITAGTAVRETMPILKMPQT